MLPEATGHPTGFGEAIGREKRHERSCGVVDAEIADRSGVERPTNVDHGNIDPRRSQSWLRVATARVDDDDLHLCRLVENRAHRIDEPEFVAKAEDRTSELRGHGAILDRRRGRHVPRRALQVLASDVGKTAVHHEPTVSEKQRSLADPAQQRVVVTGGDDDPASADDVEHALFQQSAELVVERLVHLVEEEKLGVAGIDERQPESPAFPAIPRDGSFKGLSELAALLDELDRRPRLRT